MNALGRRLHATWARLSGLRGGRWLFARVLGRMVPYSGTIRPRVVELEPGRVVVSIRERRALRNHLRSVHAVALANLGELSSGLAMTLRLPAGVRGIPTRIDTEYLKKARGTITAVGRAEPPDEIRDAVDAIATAEMSDETGDVVARTTVRWRLSPEGRPASAAAPGVAAPRP